MCQSFHFLNNSKEEEFIFLHAFKLEILLMQYTNLAAFNLEDPLFVPIDAYEVSRIIIVQISIYVNACTNQIF